MEIKSWNESYSMLHEDKFDLRKKEEADDFNKY
jgi:hypothetical protein